MVLRDSNDEWGGELFDPSTTPSLRATPPVPGGELIPLLFQIIHTFHDWPYRSPELSQTDKSRSTLIVKP